MNFASAHILTHTRHIARVRMCVHRCARTYMRVLAIVDALSMRVRMFVELPVASGTQCNNNLFLPISLSLYIYIYIYVYIYIYIYI